MNAVLNPNESLADFVLAHPECAGTIERHGMRCCCHSDVTIEGAVRAKGLNADLILRDLVQAITGREAGRAWSLDANDFFVSSHLVYARRMLPVIAVLADDVAACRASGAPPLEEVRQVIDELTVALLPTGDEDIALLDEEGFDGTAVAQVLDAMARDRYCISCLVIQLREAVQRLPLPDRACGAYRTLFRELVQLSHDAALHLSAMPQGDQCAA